MVSSGTSIQLKHIFGMKSDTPQILHVEEHKVVYPAGHNIVSYNTEDKIMQFFPGIQGSYAITSLALSPVRRYLAVAEKADPATIFIYDTHTQRKKETLSTTNIDSNEYVSMAFAPGQENKWIISLSGAPDYKLVLWNWSLPKVQDFIQVSSNPVYQISFNIQDYQLGIIATGYDTFRCYKTVENKLVPSATSIARKDPNLSTNYVLHQWLNDGNLIVENDMGDILILDGNCEYIGYIPPKIEGFVAHSIIPYSEGFILGGTGSTMIFYKRTMNETNPYVSQYDNVVISEHLHDTIDRMDPAISAIRCIALPQSEDSITVILENSQILRSNFNSERPDQGMTFEYLMCYFHHNTITGLDVCLRKPILATCGKDKTVRIWNYQERCIEVCHQCNEEPYSVAIHPSGFYIIVGFTDKLKLMNVFSSTLKEYHSISIKQCKEVHFSHGGHLFAAANHQEIRVYSFYNLEKPSMNFKGHGGKVQAIAWTQNDLGFVSVALDGSIYEWELYSKRDTNQVQEIIQKKSQFTDVIITQDQRHEGHTIYASAQDGRLKEIADKEVTYDPEIGTTIGPLALSTSTRTLFAGVSESDMPGPIRCYKITPFVPECSEVQAHSLPVVRLRISHDEQFLFSVGHDGCLCMFEIKDREIRGSKRQTETLALLPAEEIIITRSEITDTDEHIKTLKGQVTDLTNTGMVPEVGSSGIQNKIDQLMDLQKSDEALWKNKYETALETKNDLDKKHFDSIEKLQNDVRDEKEELETSLQQKIMGEVSKYSDLSREKEQDQRRYEEDLKKLAAKQAQEILELEDRHQTELENKQDAFEDLVERMDEQKRSHEEHKKQLRDDNAEELKLYRDQNDFQLQELKAQSSKRKADLSILDKKVKVLQQDIDKMDEEIKAHQETINLQKEQKDKLEKEKEDMSNNIRDRDSTIGQKEKRIYDLKRKNGELEKFKNVLDYKIKELKREMTPREEEISKMKEETAKMDHELKHLNGVNECLGITVDNLRVRQEGMQDEINKQRARLRESYNRLKSLKNGIYDTVQHIQDFKKLKESFLKIFNKYVSGEVRQLEVDGDIKKEYGHQRKYLAKNVSSLNGKLYQVSQIHKGDKIKIMRDNMDLIDEITRLRAQKKELFYVRKKAEIITAKTHTQSMSKLGGSVGEEDYRRELNMQKEEIRHLRERIAEAEEQQSRPGSRRMSFSERVTNENVNEN